MKLTPQMLDAMIDEVLTGEKKLIQEHKEQPIKLTRELLKKFMKEVLKEQRQGGILLHSS